MLEDRLEDEEAGVRGGGSLAGRARDQIKAGKDLRISQCPRAGRGGRRARGGGVRGYAPCSG